MVLAGGAAASGDTVSSDAPSRPTSTVEQRSPRHRLGLRTTTALWAGQSASWMSRAAGAGSGAIIGGRVTLALAPRALNRLAAGRTVALVSGTNGKTTTSHLLTAALRTQSDVATNHTGANMPDGIVAALGRRHRLRAAPGHGQRPQVAVAEVDEPYLPEVVTAVSPAVVLLLNLSRDQLDRVSEVRQVEAAVRRALTALHPSTLVVANRDDVLVTSAARDAPAVVWVAAGAPWSDDATTCPRCGRPIRRDGKEWECVCGLAVPWPDWALDGDHVRTPDGRRLPLGLQLPGRANRANATMALAAAVSLGVPAASALAAMREVTQVNGRYRVHSLGRHEVRLILAKNPAGWSETLAMIAASHAPVVVAVNAREADGRDPSWLWDVPFEALRGRPVAASGERATDLAVRLTYAEVDHQTSADPLAALDLMPDGPVELIANYTSFLDLTDRLADAR